MTTAIHSVEVTKKVKYMLSKQMAFKIYEDIFYHQYCREYIFFIRVNIFAGKRCQIEKFPEFRTGFKDLHYQLHCSH